MKFYESFKSSNPIVIMTDMLQIRPVEIAYHVGCSEVYISHWKSGRNKIPSNSLKKLKKLTQKTLSELDNEYGDYDPVATTVEYVYRLIEGGLFDD